MMPKRSSPACLRNQQPIYEQLSIYFKHCTNVLEIGSGTGQHAVFFAEKMPYLTWHTSDMPENHECIAAWIDGSSLKNVRSPITFTIGQDKWPDVGLDGVLRQTLRISCSHMRQR